MSFYIRIMKFFTITCVGLDPDEVGLLESTFFVDEIINPMSKYDLITAMRNMTWYLVQ